MCMSSVFAQVLQIVQLLKAHRERRRLEAMQMLPDDSGYEYDMLAEEHQPSRVGKAEWRRCICTWGLNQGGHTMYLCDA